MITLVGEKTRNYQTLIMDGSDPYVVRDILLMIDLITGDFETINHPLDEEHPSIIVLETKTNKDVYELIEVVIESEFPGLCIFNPEV